MSLNQRYRYTGKPFDEDGGIDLYYYGARYYDPTLGRFLAIDPLASKNPGWSPYVYCLNNPLKYVDPDGRRLKTVIKRLAKTKAGKWAIKKLQKVIGKKAVEGILDIDLSPMDAALPDADYAYHEVDSDGNGQMDAWDDFDGDGIPNWQETDDADGDGIPDWGDPSVPI